MSINKKHNSNIDDKSGSEMLSEIMYLLLKLLLKGFTKICRAIVKGFRLLFKLFKRSMIALLDFWNDNSTQEKVRSFRLWTVKVLKLTFQAAKATLIFFGKILLAAILLSVRGIIKLVKMTALGLIHLKPTLIFLKDITIKGFVCLGHGITALYNAISRQWNKLKTSYSEFRKTKGFKGLLIDIKNSLQTRLNNYIEDEENSEYTSETVSYEEYITTEVNNGEKKGIISWWVNFCTKVNKALDVIIGSE